MSLIANDPIIRQDIIDRFNTRVRDFATSNTNWKASTVIIPARAGTTILVDKKLNDITSNSTTGGTVRGGNYPGNYPGGTYNRTTFEDPQPASITESEFTSEIGANVDVAGHVLNLLKSFMVTYANNHKINLRNTGNISVVNAARTTFNLITHTGTARLDNVLSTVSNNVISDVNTKAAERGISTGAKITAQNLYDFIEDCRSIWFERCQNTAVEEFAYSYCHSSCHSNHGSHGSRGRR